jgi:hypothetical protein
VPARRPARRTSLRTGCGSGAGSLLSKQGYSLAEISERLGDTKVVTAERYLYALGDYTEVDYAVTLGR